MNYFSDKQTDSVMAWYDKIVRRVVQSAKENGVAATSDILVLREVGLVEPMTAETSRKFEFCGGRFSMSFDFLDGDGCQLTGSLIFSGILRLVALMLVDGPEKGSGSYFYEADLFKKHDTFIKEFVLEATTSRYVSLEAVEMLDKNGLLLQSYGKIKTVENVDNHSSLCEAAFMLFYNFSVELICFSGCLFFNKHYELVLIDQMEPVEKKFSAVHAWYKK